MMVRPDFCYPSSLNVQLALGYHGDLNETYPVGRIDDDAKKLIRTSRQCLDEAIKICKPGALFRDIGKAMYMCLVC
jgi:methionine aminopeptidase